MRALLFFGEVLARRGDEDGAAAVWRAAEADPSIPGGERDAARRWRRALPGAAQHDGHTADLGDDARARLIADVLDLLTASPPG